jgi:hypothetical protein
VLEHGEKSRGVIAFDVREGSEDITLIATVCEMGKQDKRIAEISISGDGTGGSQ